LTLVAVDTVAADGADVGGGEDAGEVVCCIRAGPNVLIETAP